MQNRKIFFVTSRNSLVKSFIFKSMIYLGSVFIRGVTWPSTSICCQEPSCLSFLHCVGCALTENPLATHVWLLSRC